VYRGWVKQWRREVHSGIWDKPPLYLKVWQWLKLSVDRETGTIRRSLRGIAQEVSWTENKAPRAPNPKTIKTILDWMEAQEMVTQSAQGIGNTQYRDITLCNWERYQASKEDISNEENTHTGNTERSHNKKYQEEQEERGGADAPSSARVKKKIMDRKTKLRRSPHWDFIDRFSRCFYELSHTTYPTDTELVAAQEEVERVLRIDMKDAEGCENRLGQFVRWATEDDFWQANLLSLAQLRKKRNGVMKWVSIERQMLRDEKQISSFPTAPDIRPAPKHADEIRIQGDAVPAPDLHCHCNNGYIREDNRSRSCPNCERGRHFATRGANNDHSDR